MLIKRHYLILMILCSLAIGFGGGFEFKRLHAANSLPLINDLFAKDPIPQPETVDFSLFWETWNSLSRKYVDEGKIDHQKMIYGAIGGMVDSIGDPYTVFFEPPVTKKFEEEISGSFGGVGIEVGERDNILTVIAPIEGTPAHRAGIVAGERILAIDGKSTAPLSSEEAVSFIRGERGTKVVLTISNADRTKSREVELVREAIKVPTVKYLTLKDGKVGYIKIATFNQNVDPDFDDAVKKFRASGASSLILDLRNNPGGLLDSAINLSGYFLEKEKVVVQEEFRDKSTNAFRSDGDAVLKAYTIIVLINGGSASASEILAGALHDHDRARLLGEKTFGKGSVQELVKFNGGSSLKVTIAKWLTPNGDSITEKGIEPDIEVTIPDEDFTEGKIEFGTPGKDPQLDRALELLK